MYIFLYIQNLFWKKRCWSRFTRSKVCSAWGSLVKCGSGKYHLHPLALNSLEGMVFFLHNINDNFWRLNFADVFIYSSSHNHGSEKMGSLEDVLSLQMVLFFPRPWLPWLWEEEKMWGGQFPGFLIFSRLVMVITHLPWFLQLMKVSRLRFNIFPPWRHDALHWLFHDESLSSEANPCFQNHPNIWDLTRGMTNYPDMGIIS